MHSTSSPGKCETEARFCCLYPELLDSHLQNLCDLSEKRCPGEYERGRQGLESYRARMAVAEKLQ